MQQFHFRAGIAKAKLTGHIVIPTIGTESEKDPSENDDPNDDDHVAPNDAPNDFDHEAPNDAPDEAPNDGSQHSVVVSSARYVNLANTSTFIT